MPERLEALAFGLDRRGIEAEVRAWRQDPPGVRGMGVVGPVTGLMVGLEMFHVRVQLDEALLLGDPHICRQGASQAMARWPPAEPPAVLRNVIERDPELSPVDQLERQVMEVRIAL